MRPNLKVMLLAGLICTGASAQTLLTIDGDTTGAPTFNQPGIIPPFGALSGTFVPFEAIPFVVSPAGVNLTSASTFAVRLELVSPPPVTFDTALYLYSDFDPSNPLANGIAADDDTGQFLGGCTLCARIDTFLAPGEYVAVVTS